MPCPHRASLHDLIAPCLAHTDAVNSRCSQVHSCPHRLAHKWFWANFGAVALLPRKANPFLRERLSDTLFCLVARDCGPISRVVRSRQQRHHYIVLTAHVAVGSATLRLLPIKFNGANSSSVVIVDPEIIAGWHRERPRCECPIRRSSQAAHAPEHNPHPLPTV